MGAIDRPKKRSGRHAVRLRRDGITARLSCSFNFLTIRVVIGVGGFLGVGEHLVAVAFDKIKFVNEPVAYTGASNVPAPGSRPASSTTTGAATTNTAPATATASKPNPWYPDHALFNATKDELKAMPEFKYST
jgi:hypothetical protein